MLVVVPMLVITEQDENQWSFSNNYVRVFAEHFKLEVKLRLDKPQDRLMLMLLMVIVVVLVVAGKVGVYQEPLESLVTEVC